MVRTTDPKSNNCALLPPTIQELRDLANTLEGLTLVPLEQLPRPSKPRPLRRRLAPAVIRKLVHRYTEGEPSTKLCEEFKIAKSALLKILREEGVVLRRQSPTTDAIAEAVRLYGQGLSIARIANNLAISGTSVRRALLGAGVEMRTRADYRAAVQVATV